MGGAPKRRFDEKGTQPQRAILQGPGSEPPAGCEKVLGKSHGQFYKPTDYLRGTFALKHGGRNALAVWLSWLEHCPVPPKAVGSISGQGAYLHSGFHPLLRNVWEANN